MEGNDVEDVWETDVIGTVKDATVGTSRLEVQRRRCGLDVLPWLPLRGTADSERRHQQGSAVDLCPIPLSKNF